MKKHFIPIVLFALIPVFQVRLQESRLADATKEDALFTTYAAPLARSAYRNDQGYRLLWDDDEAGVEFISSDGPNIGIDWRMGKEEHFSLQSLYRQPVVEMSYSDLVRFNYYPFRDLRAEITFCVWSSTQGVEDILITNESEFVRKISFGPVNFAVPKWTSRFFVARRLFVEDSRA